MADIADLIAQAKADAANLYQQAVDGTLAQQQQIEQSYAAASASGINDALSRQAGDQQYLEQKNSEMNRGAAASGLDIGPNISAGTQGVLGLYGNQTASNANLWKNFFDTTKGTAVGRNTAAAQSFSHGNEEQQAAYDRELAAAIAASYGSGGGGGSSGGSGSDDEEVWTAPELGDTTDGLIKGMVASQRRYEGQAARQQSNPTNSASGGKPTTKTTLRRGGGGSF